MKSYRYDIQGLRAVAVFLVFIFHLMPTILSGGFVGVDVFFVISGFLVGGIILHKKEQKTFSFVSFYISRIKRIVPVFILLLILVAVIGSWVYLSSDISFLRKILFHSAIFNSNNYFASLDSYFGAKSLENALLHTWTLSIEMQFYLLLPFIIFFVRPKYLLHVLLTFTFLSIFYSVSYLKGGYFSLFARMSEFMVGVVFALKQESWRDKISLYQNSISIIAVCGIVLSACFFDENTVFPGIWVLVPVFGTALLLITQQSWVNRFISNKVFVFIGELSYSIYLWHWSIMAFVRYYNNEMSLGIWQMIGITLLTLLLSYLSYTFVENKYRKFDNKKFVVYFTPLIVLLGISAFSTFKLNNYFSGIPVEYSKPTFGLKSHGKTYENIQILGDKNVDTKICLLGDSHALSYKGFIDYIGKKNYFSVKTVTNDRYPTLPYIAEDDFETNGYLRQYQKLMKQAQGLIRDSEIIIISSAWMEKVPSLEKAFGRMVKELKPSQKVIVLGDFPTFEKNPIKVVRGYKSESLHYDFGSDTGLFMTVTCQRKMDFPVTESFDCACLRGNLTGDFDLRVFIMETCQQLGEHIFARSCAASYKQMPENFPF